MEELKAYYGDDIRIVFRHMPLIGIHDKAQITAEAAEAAGAQDKFWEMHDIIFERFEEWSSVDKTDMPDILIGYAEEIELDDLDQFKADLDSGTYAAKVLGDYEAAGSAGVTGTPTFLVNQLDYPAGMIGFEPASFDFFLNLMTLRENWYEQPPEQVIDPEKAYIATIETEKGDIVIELFPDTAPVNVNSFVFLAQEGWYEGLSFHRVLPGFVAQGGDPTGTGAGFPGYRCDDEVTPERSFDEPGLLSLANSGANTDGAQFFITYDAVPQLNEGFTVIGRVIEGMDVAQGITPRDPQQNPNAPPGDTIINITIAEKS